MHSSEVAAGRIARFTSTRLCCSHILSIQDMFGIHMWIKMPTLVIADRMLPPVPVLLLSGLSCRQMTTSDWFPRTIKLYHKEAIYTISLKINCATEHFVFTILTKNTSTTSKVTICNFFSNFYNFFFCFF